ncbi:hypothetical protein D9M71_163600 [compost metagenome]
MHVAASAVGRNEGDEPVAVLHQQRRRVVADHVGRAQSHVEDVHQLQGFLPEGTGVDQILVQEGHVVHQQVEAALLLFDTGEQRAHLLVITMVAGHGDTQATGVGHCLGGFGEAARQQLATQVAGALGRGAAAEVNGHTGGPQGNGDALADATAGTGDQGDAGFVCSHGFLPYGCAKRTKSPHECFGALGAPCGA